MLAAAAATGAPPSTRRLIEMGWDEPDTRFMRQHIAVMEKAPFDGCVFHVLYTRPDGKPGNFTWEFWGKRAFHADELQPALDDLKATRFHRFTDNFLRINVTPGDAGWFDDDSVVVINARLAARLARAAHCRIMLDTEAYQAKIWNASQISDRPWDELAARVRARGRAVMAAIQDEYPDVTVLVTLGHSFAWHETTLLKVPLARCPNGLLAPFMDGMFDAAAGNTQIVDGYELSYDYRDSTSFTRAARTMRKGVLPIVADSTRYRRHGRIGFGLWMDNASNKVGWDTLDVSRNKYPPGPLRSALEHALATTDRYVWVYSEQPRWWTGAGHTRALPPAYVQAVVHARRAAGLP